MKQLFQRYKKLIVSIAILAVMIPASSYALIALTPVQGGTGISSVTAGDVGKFLKVTNNSPFTYALATVTAPAWGAITGTLSAQTDLNTALGLLQPIAITPTSTQTASTVATAINLLDTRFHAGSFGTVFDGQGATITTNNYTEVQVPYTGTITDFYLHSITPSTGADLSCSSVFDVKRAGTSIIGAGNKPTLSSAATQTAAVSSWTSASVTAGDVLSIYNVSNTGCVKETLSFNVTK